MHNLKIKTKTQLHVLVTYLVPINIKAMSIYLLKLQNMENWQTP